MSSVIKVEYIWYSILNNLKKILVGTVIIMLLSVMYLFLVKAEPDVPLYCSSGLVYANNEKEIINSDGKTETVNENGQDSEYILVGDKVIDKIAADKSINMKKDEIKESLILSTESEGQIIRVNAVTNDANLSENICRKVLEYGTEVLSSYKQKVEVLERSTAAIPVTVELWEDPSNPSASKSIIKEAQQSLNSISMSDIVKRIIISFIFGFLVLCASFSIFEIALNRIRYPAQIESVTDMKVLGVIPAKGK